MENTHRILELEPKNSSELQEGLDQVGFDKEYDILHLSSNTIIDERLLIQDGTRITCDKGTLWKLSSSIADDVFGEHIPVLGQKDKTISDIIVEGIIYDGNYTNPGKAPRDNSKGYGNFIGLENCTNCTFAGITIWNTQGDGFKLVNANGVRFEKDYGKIVGHDFVHLKECNNVDVLGCYCETRANNAVRVRSSSNVNIKGNTFKGTKESWGSLIQVENMKKGGKTNKVDISKNKILDSMGPGIWLFGGEPIEFSKEVYIHNNLIKGCGCMPKESQLSDVGGIIFDGFTELYIYYNTLDCNYGYGIGHASYAGSSGIPGCKVKIHSNIIVNMKKANYPGIASGTPIFSKDVVGHTFVSGDNCLFHNNNRKYHNIIGRKDIYMDPRFVDPISNDYHLKSRNGHWSPSGMVKDYLDSPCIFEDRELGMYNGTDEMSIWYGE